MKHTNTRSLTIALLIALAAAGVVHAQEAGLPAVDWQVIAGGGGPSTGGEASLNDTLGQAVVGPSGGGDTGLQAGYWAQCVSAAAVAPAVAVARSGDDAVLSWPAVPADARYQVWVSTNPYFDPGNPGGVTPIVTESTVYIDTGAAASPENHFYVVRGIDACGDASGNSNRAGEFTFAVAPGAL